MKREKCTIEQQSEKSFANKKPVPVDDGTVTGNLKGLCHEIERILFYLYG
jgi:hypothetical protein